MGRNISRRTLKVGVLKVRRPKSKLLLIVLTTLVATATFSAAPFVAAGLRSDQPELDAGAPPIDVPYDVGDIEPLEADSSINPQPDVADAQEALSRLQRSQVPLSEQISSIERYAGIGERPYFVVVTLPRTIQPQALEESLLASMETISAGVVLSDGRPVVYTTRNVDRLQDEFAAALAEIRTEPLDDGSIVARDYNIEAALLSGQVVVGFSLTLQNAQALEAELRRDALGVEVFDNTLVQPIYEVPLWPADA